MSAPENSTPAIAAEQLTKIYGSGNTEVVAMQDVSLTIARGEVIALLGPSGAGKSTLLTAIGLINPPTSGRIFIGGELVKRLGAIRLTSYAMCVSSVAVLLHFVLVSTPGSLVQPPPVYWLSLLNATLCTVLPVFATMLAIERIGAGGASMAAMVGPVATIGLAFVFLGEPVTGWQLAGTALVLAGVYVLTLPPKPAAAVATSREAS